MIYNTLAHYYDALVKDEEASREWVSWIESELAPCDCLELACGSGEITEMLVKKGYTMTALDLSEEMVKQAKSKNLEGSIQFLCQDMRNLSNLGSYSSIFCLCDSFNYILEKEAPEGYTLNPERMYFEILEDGKVVKATMTDEKVVIEVPSTGITDTHIIEIAGALFVLGGIGVIVYVKKKKQK